MRFVDWNGLFVRSLRVCMRVGFGLICRSTQEGRIYVFISYKASGLLFGTQPLLPFALLQIDPVPYQSSAV